MGRFRTQMGERFEEINRRADKRFEEINRRADERYERLTREADERHRQLLERGKADQRIFIEALTEIDASLKSNTERLDDMGEAIRANTQAVLAALDRFGPAPG